MDADLQHDAARHPGRRIAPGRQVKLSEPVAADIGFALHDLPKSASENFRSDPAEVALASALVAKRQYDAVSLANARDGVAIGHTVGNRFVEKDMLAGFRRHLRG